MLLHDNGGACHLPHVAITSYRQSYGGRQQTIDMRAYGHIYVPTHNKMRTLQRRWLARTPCPTPAPDPLFICFYVTVAAYVIAQLAWVRHKRKTEWEVLEEDFVRLNDPNDGKTPLDLAPQEVCVCQVGGHLLGVYR